MGSNVKNLSMVDSRAQNFWAADNDSIESTFFPDRRVVDLAIRHADGRVPGQGTVLTRFRVSPEPSRLSVMLIKLQFALKSIISH